MRCIRVARCPRSGHEGCAPASNEPCRSTRPCRSALGTGPAGLRIATFEDMTVEQASLPYAEWQALSGREQAAAIKRQARAYSQAVACCFTTHWAADSAVDDYGVPRNKVHGRGVGRNHSP